MGSWARNIRRQHNENMKQMKENSDKMKSYRDKRATSRPQLRRMKLTAEEKRELAAKISENYDHLSEKEKRRK